jgi:hypothetical protein
MRALNPHHSIAKLTSKPAQLVNSRARKLADRTVTVNCKEIAVMGCLIYKIEGVAS